MLERKGESAAIEAEGNVEFTLRINAIEVDSVELLAGIPTRSA